MKKSQRDPVVKIDEFEDLTLYANESFDTQDVDLFEFSSEESSPLVRLKSIILSLDWEINDEILQELADEISSMESQWQGDKVAEVYLQGLNKLGAYIRLKGAYAHPNSIKLLLTFFYNFEKIISSQNITSEEITQLLTSDVRKFRILQYQINQIEEESTLGIHSKTSKATLSNAPDSTSAATDYTKQLKAAILSLDWEVTDESLKQFDTRLSQFQGMFAEDKPISVLVQGLQVLGDYIAEKRAESHPEAFVLLHSFNEALEQLVPTDQPPLDPKAVQELLVDRVNRINTLKMLVAALPTSPLDAQALDTFVDEISSSVAMQSVSDLPFQPKEEVQAASSALTQEQVTRDATMGAQADALFADSLEAEIDTLFAIDTKPAMETADIQYPDEILPSDAIQALDDELADDFIEASLSTKRGLKPALSDTEELSGYNEEAEPLDLPAQIDLAQQLDFLFPETDAETTNLVEALPTIDVNVLAIEAEDEEQPIAALADVSAEEMSVLKENTFSDTEGPAGSGERRQKDSAAAQSALDIQSQLDDFFAETIEEPAKFEPASEVPVEEIERTLFFSEENGMESALADSDEHQGFSAEEAVASLASTPMGEIEEKLNFFFGTKTDDESLVMAEKITSPTLEAFATEEDPDVSTADKEPAGALDFFLDANEDDEEETSQTGADELTQALEATIDDRPAALASDFFQEEPPAARLPEDDKEVQIATLGALLPGVVRTPSREKVAEFSQLITALQNAGLPSEQQALVQLLNSVIGLLLRLPPQEGAATEKLANYLYVHLLEEQCRPEVLPEAVKQFTNWMHEVFAIMPSLPKISGQESEPHFEYTAKELYFELSELRGHLNQEFAKIRHELHHKN